jgi:hypothetical protein
LVAEIEDDVIGRIGNTRSNDEKYLQYFGQKTGGEETA